MLFGGIIYPPDFLVVCFGQAGNRAVGIDQHAHKELMKGSTATYSD
jgi:hypothetical protein